MPSHEYIRVIRIIKRSEFEAAALYDHYRQVSIDDAELDFNVVGYEDTYVPSRNGDAA